MCYVRNPPARRTQQDEADILGARKLVTNVSLKPDVALRLVNSDDINGALCNGRLLAAVCHALFPGNVPVAFNTAVAAISNLYVLLSHDPDGPRPAWMPYLCSPLASAAGNAISSRTRASAPPAVAAPASPWAPAKSAPRIDHDHLSGRVGPALDIC